jgi:hypothetical protein
MTRPRRTRPLWTLLLALAGASCAQILPGEQPPLAEALRLEMRLAARAHRVATPFEMRFALRNVAKVPVVFCQLDSGVSVVLLLLRDLQEQPIVIRGQVLNPADSCNERTTLKPGEAVPFREIVRLRPDFDGEARVFGYIRVHRVGPIRGAADVPTIRSRDIPVRLE